MNDTTPRASSKIPRSLPPVTRHMALYANRAAPRFKPYQLGGRFPTALENRFTTKYILKHNDADISLIDVHQGKELFKSGMSKMPNATVRRAVIAKRADVESKRLRALATAWELESTEKHAMLLQSVLKDKAEEYVDSMAETTFFEKELEDDADFTVAAYTHDLAAHQIADEQLNHLEEIGVERGMHLPLNDPSDGASDDAEVRLDECLESILKEAENSKMFKRGGNAISATQSTPAVAAAMIKLVRVTTVIWSLYPARLEAAPGRKQLLMLEGSVGTVQHADSTKVLVF
ncbi:hypothetical protein EDD22DRAFT_853402 [Suillus occidentalis]|nr:hypothetical protein EDD22DRAFT_853402 [Suillus occidentalis]